jgi:hypothetical protein
MPIAATPCSRANQPPCAMSLLVLQAAASKMGGAHLLYSVLGVVRCEEQRSRGWSGLVVWAASTMPLHVWCMVAIAQVPAQLARPVRGIMLAVAVLQVGVQGVGMHCEIHC